jgi:hypothetical protein
MRLQLHVVYDDEGNILAASQVPVEDLIRSAEPGSSLLAGVDVPQPEPGEHAAKLDVPEEFAVQDPLEVVRRLRVDVNENRLVERG